MVVVVVVGVVVVVRGDVVEVDNSDSDRGHDREWQRSKVSGRARVPRVCMRMRTCGRGGCVFGVLVMSRL